MNRPGRRRHDAVPTVPIDTLLDLGVAARHVERRVVTGESGRAARAVGHGRCPLHADPKASALVWSGAHWSWREHTYRTWSGTPFTCGASLQLLCQLPALPVPGEPTPTCPCETEST